MSKTTGEFVGRHRNVQVDAFMKETKWLQYPNSIMVIIKRFSWTRREGVIYLHHLPSLPHDYVRVVLSVSLSCQVSLLQIGEYTPPSTRFIVHDFVLVRYVQGLKGRG